LFSSAPPKVTSLDLDPNDESVTGTGTFRPVHGSKKAYDAAIVALRASFQKKGKEDNVSTDEDDLRSHGINDWSYHGSHPASVVVWAERSVQRNRLGWEMRNLTPALIASKMSRKS